MMNFANLINEISRSSESQENFLTDSKLTCRYPEIPNLIEKIDHYLAHHGIATGDCLAIECINSVPSAVLLIYLLTKRIGFMLLPPSENADKSSVLKPIPRFCQFRLTVLPLLEKEDADWMLHLDKFIRVEPRKLDANNEALTRIDTEDRLFVRTSGSMGEAKIVVYDQTRVLSSAYNCVNKYQFTAEDRMAIPVPIFHMYGFGAEFLPALLVGGSIDLQENSNLLKYLDRERRFLPTIAFITPNLCEMLIRGWKKPRPYKVIVTSGQRIREDLFRAFDPLCGNRLVNQYGSTEMGPIAACNPSDSLDLRTRSIGSPMNGVELRIETTDDTTDSGELYCRHPYAFEGYMNESGQWLAKAQEWHRTGDLAKTDQDTLIVTGRADSSINRSGYLILLADIEKALETLDDVVQAVVVPIQAENIQGQSLVAFCVKMPNAPVTDQHIRTASAKILPKYAVPDSVVLLDALPLLPSGKADQQALKTYALSTVLPKL